MKRGIAWLCRLAIILLCVALLCATVSAVTESASKTGVMVQLSTPKDTYKAGEEIGVRLNVVNYSMGTVTGNYTVTLPDCCPFFLGLNHGKLNEAKKKYGDKIKIRDPGYLGAVLLSCETDEFTVWDIVKEFDMEPLRGYFGRVADIRKQILECDIK